MGVETDSLRLLSFVPEAPLSEVSQHSVTRSHTWGLQGAVTRAAETRTPWSRGVVGRHSGPRIDALPFFQDMRRRAVWSRDKVPVAAGETLWDRRQ